VHDLAKKNQEEFTKSLKSKKVGEVPPPLLLLLQLLLLLLLLQLLLLTGARCQSDELDGLGFLPVPLLLLSSKPDFFPKKRSKGTRGLFPHFESE
jgi:hypothetical protein